LMDDVYLLTTPFNFQAMRSTPPTAPDASSAFAFRRLVDPATRCRLEPARPGTAERYNQAFDLAHA